MFLVEVFKYIRLNNKNNNIDSCLSLFFLVYMYTCRGDFGINELTMHSKPWEFIYRYMNRTYWCRISSLNLITVDRCVTTVYLPITSKPYTSKFRKCHLAFKFKLLMNNSRLRKPKKFKCIIDGKELLPII